ncbi:MAG: tRNA (cytidine(34)-2'-O)-methyltransferase [Leptonema sp. (in: Bacteria)]|nr:tRNA (cytidine(34)-2'-O)-methyltransferase [Leptonema sp. (in: bacteria)]
MQIVLFEPKIPQNTGNIIRLCACTGASLTIVGEPAFSMDDAHMRRAGLDYYKELTIERAADWPTFMKTLESNGQGWADIAFLSRFGRRTYTDYSYKSNAVLVFGNEPHGLPESIKVEIEKHAPDQLLRIPVSKRCRSLNLANAVSLLVYEVLRQNNFSGLLLELDS